MAAPEKEGAQKSPVAVNIHSPRNYIVVADHVEINMFCGSRAQGKPADGSDDAPVPARK
jgi:hypothetical protein